MDCNQEIFRDFLSNCNTDIILNALLTPGQPYKWVITSKTGAQYSGTANADVYGQSLTIPVDDIATLPAGLINAYGGSFKLELFDTTDDCKRISFKMTREYSEVFFETVRGTLEKDNLGCTFD